MKSCLKIPSFAMTGITAPKYDEHRCRIKNDFSCFFYLHISVRLSSLTADPRHQNDKSQSVSLRHFHNPLSHSERLHSLYSHAYQDAQGVQGQMPEASPACHPLLRKPTLQEAILLQSTQQCPNVLNYRVQFSLRLVIILQHILKFTQQKLNRIENKQYLLCNQHINLAN